MSSPFVPAPVSTRFVHVAGGRIVGPDGTPLHLRGIGLGNWLLPEGYMWGFGDAAASPTQIKALVHELVGAEAAVRFWSGFYDRFISEDDIRLIAEMGYDHVRLPINWRVVMAPDGSWIEDGFALIERLVRWSEAHGLLVLLDLHGAPGGQTGTNIDDSAGKPELFMDPRNEDLTVALWVEIARRYRDDATVLGYDLLNEPLPREWQDVYPAELVALYKRITVAIREVDPDHLLMYEGSHWATNWSIFTDVWDENSVLQFHKYWSSPDRASLASYLDAAAKLGLPIYMGEGGENSPRWIAAVHQMYDDHGIGWNFWPWKKIDTVTSPLSIVPPAGWDAVLAYVHGTGLKPSVDDARATFEALVEAFDISACEVRADVVQAMFRRAPVELPAYAFTYRGEGVSFVTTGASPNPLLRGDDAVTLRMSDGREAPAFTFPPPDALDDAVIAELAPGDWVAFEVTVPAGSWTVAVLTADGSGAPALLVDGVEAVLVAADAPGTWNVPLTRSSVAAVELRVSAGTAPVSLAAVRVDAAS